MKTFLTLIFLILLLHSSFGQRKSSKEIEDSINHQCTHRNKFTIAERLSNYPFNSSKEVKLVSISKSLGPYFLKTGKVNLSLVKEITVLDNVQIDSLTDILYNIYYNGPIFYYLAEGCYHPKNAIFFIDSTGQVFDFIELSFKCSDFKLSSKKFTHFRFCNEKYSFLKSFFRKSGILYGTN